MKSIVFRAHGHPNIQSTHRTTLEITKEDYVTKRGDCIVGIRATLALADLPKWAKIAAKKESTRIVLTLTVNGRTESIQGRGHPDLTYDDETCMVARKSSYKCGRTLMIQADKAAVDLDRAFIQAARMPESVIQCELTFITQ